jgi:hypothetical protein
LLAWHHELRTRSRRSAVVSFKPDWFEGCEYILEIYCNLVIQSRQLVGMLAEYEKGSPRWMKLGKLYVSVVGSMVRAATSMRMTVQSSRDSRHVKHAAVRGPRPWDDVEPEPREPKRKPS